MAIPQSKNWYEPCSRDPYLILKLLSRQILFSSYSCRSSGVDEGQTVRVLNLVLWVYDKVNYTTSSFWAPEPFAPNQGFETDPEVV